MPRWVRSLVPPLFGGLLGGAITFVVLSIATITYLGVLHKLAIHECQAGAATRAR
jgi:hypothetical protein